MSKSRLVTGARVVVYINGAIYAQVSDFRWNSDTGSHDLYGVDSMQPFESASTVTKCSGQISVYRLIKDGGAEGAGITAPYPDLARERYFSLTLVERSSDTIIFQARRCKLLSQSWEIPTRGYVTGSLSWTALEFSNEVIPASR